MEEEEQESVEAPSAPVPAVPAVAAACPSCAKAVGKASGAASCEKTACNSARLHVACCSKCVGCDKFFGSSDCLDNHGCD